MKYFYIASLIFIALNTSFLSWAQGIDFINIQPLNQTANNLSVKVFLDKDPFGGNIPNYSPSEHIKIGVTPLAKGYLYLFNLASEGPVNQIFPNKHDHNNFISGFSTVYVPRNPSYNLSIANYEGLNYVIAIVSKQRLEGHKITFADIFTSNINANNRSKYVPASFWASDVARFRVSAGNANNNFPTNTIQEDVNYNQATQNSSLAGEITNSATDNRSTTKTVDSSLTKNYKSSELSQADINSANSTNSNSLPEVIKDKTSNTTDSENTLAAVANNSVIGNSVADNSVIGNSVADNSVADNNTATITLAPDSLAISTPATSTSASTLANTSTGTIDSTTTTTSSLDAVINNSNTASTTTTSTNKTSLDNKLAATQNAPKALDDNEYPQDYSAVVQSKEHPYKKWLAAEIANYSFTFKQHCYCKEEYLELMYVVVRDSKVTSVVYAKNHQAVPEHVFGSVFTLGELLEGASYVENDSNAKVEGTYDKDYGFPKNLSIDRDLSSVNDEISYEISFFRVE